MSRSGGIPHFDDDDDDGDDVAEDSQSWHMEKQEG